MANGTTSFMATLCDQSDIAMCLGSQTCNADLGMEGPGCYCCNGVTCPHWKNYSAQQLLQMTYPMPLAVGCWTWDGCDFAVNHANQAGSPPSDIACPFVYPSIQTVVIDKTGYDQTLAKPCCASTLSGSETFIFQGHTVSRDLFCDPAWEPGSRVCDTILFPPDPCGNADARNPDAPEENRYDCCMGQVLAQDLQKCRPEWCPNDPLGSCTDIFLSSTCAAFDDVCHKSKWLVSSYTCDTCTDQSPCNDWYQAATGQIGHPSYLQAQTAVEAWCQSEGFASGECGCLMGHDRIEASKAQKKTPIFGLSGDHPTMPTFRRVDLFCVGGSGTEKYGTNSTFAQACLGGAGATSSANTPITPSPGDSILEWLPMHCWLGDCQPNSDFCRFPAPQDDVLKCPNICAQIAGGNRVSIGGQGGVDASDVIIIDSLFESCAFPDGAQALGGDGQPVFSLLDENGNNTLQLEYCVPIGGSATDIPLSIVNNANDPRWASLSDISYAARTNLPPLASITQNSQGTLTSGGTQSIVLRLDPSQMTNYEAQYNGEIAIFDTTGANNPLEVYLTVNVLSQDAVGPKGECAQSSESRRWQGSLQPSNQEKSCSVDWKWYTVVGVALLVGIVLLVLGSRKAWPWTKVLEAKKVVGLPAPVIELSGLRSTNNPVFRKEV